MTIQECYFAETLHSTSLPCRIMAIFMFLIIAGNPLAAQTIINLTVAQRTDGSGMVDVYYTLTGTAATYYISMEASFNNGSTFSSVASNYLSCHIGAVAPGTGRHIVWNGKGSNNNTYSTQTKVKLIVAASAPCGQPFTDARDGKIYNTVQIGTQCWMAQNLNIGTKINGSGDQTNNSIIEKYCYNDLESNCDIYGGLYQWDEMMQYVTTAGAQGICPSGWYIPTDGEWTTVTTFLGGTYVAGGKMKTTGTIEAGTGLWYSPNTAATNESGFSAIPAGYRTDNGAFYNIGWVNYWWNSSEYNTSRAWFRLMQSIHGQAVGNNWYKVWGYSVRCLSDNCTSYSPVGISITPSSNPVCSGTAVTFTATPANGGTNPVYQWKKGGTVISGATAATYTYTPANGDVIACALTSNATCISGNPATSNAVTMTVTSTPGSPVAGMHTATQTQITWNWNTIAGASGYKWNTSDNYATATDLGTVTTKTETGLTCNTAYTRYIWAYNTCGNSASTTLNQNTLACPTFTCGQVLTDTRDGKTYPTVLVNGQCWTAKNMNIGTKMAATSHQQDNSIIEKYCYDNTDANCDTYGGLYQWAEAVQYLNGATNITSWNPVPTGPVQGICPSGWHMVTTDEFASLATSLGGNTAAGGPMKEAGTGHWASPNTGGTNSTGLTVLPGGGASVPSGNFGNLTLTARLWSSTEFDATTSNYRLLSYFNTAANDNSSIKTSGASVRCIKD